MVTVCCKSTFIQTGTFVKWEDCEVWVVLSILPSKPTCAYPSKANDDWEAGLFSDARYGSRKKISPLIMALERKVSPLNVVLERKSSPLNMVL